MRPLEGHLLSQSARPDRYRFGPFEVDPESGELFKSGIRIRLPGQSFQILHYLLEHPAELVTREQLRDRLWGADTFVEFEHGLNVAMNRLRRALSDSAENSRYIETVSGRGYRFIGVIDSRPMKVEEPVIEMPPDARAEQRPRLDWRIAVAAGVGAALVLGLALGFYLHARSRQAAVSKGTIVLAEFRNMTGDTDFDGTLRQGLAVELAQSPFLSLLSEGRVRSTLRLMGRSPTESLTPELARDVCERTGSSAVLAGSIARLGREYVIALDAESCDGESLGKEQEQTASKEAVLQAVTRVVGRFRKRAGESFATIHQHDVSLAEATTPSLDALKAYSMARKEAFTTGFGAAIPFLKRAVELDPQFAMAHAFLGRIYADTGDSDRSRESTRLAYQFRDRASDREKFFITFSYDRQVTGDLESAARTLILFARTYPRDPDAHSLLSGFTGSGTGRYEMVVDEAQKAIALDPDVTPAYINLATGYLALNRMDEAKRALETAAHRGLEIPDALVFEYVIAFVRNDQQAMGRLAEQAKGRLDAEDWVTHLAALAAAYSGRVAQAHSLSQRAIELTTKTNETERAGIYQVAVAYWEALFGETSAAREHATAALHLSSTRDVQYAAALVFALCGDMERSRVLADDLKKRFPADSQVNLIYLPVLHAAAALRRKQATEAIGALNLIGSYDAATPGTSFFGFFGGFFPSYLRGVAYLEAGRGPEAVVEFRKVIAHPGIVLLDPTGALAHLEMARAFTLCGDREKAKAGYEHFLADWRAADGDVPVHRLAKVEYRQLCGRVR